MTPAAAPPQPPSKAPRIDWDAAPAQLRAGDLSGLDTDSARLLREMAAQPGIIALAHKLGLSALVLVIGLLAHAASAGNRSAARVARAILRGVPQADIETGTALLGLA